MEDVLPLAKSGSTGHVCFKICVAELLLAARWRCVVSTVTSQQEGPGFNSSDKALYVWSLHVLKKLWPLLISSESCHKVESETFTQTSAVISSQPFTRHFFLVCG